MDRGRPPKYESAFVIVDRPEFIPPRGKPFNVALRATLTNGKAVLVQSDDSHDSRLEIRAKRTTAANIASLLDVSYGTLKTDAGILFWLCEKSQAVDAVGLSVGADTDCQGA